jgi:hypothetical protein
LAHLRLLLLALGHLHLHLMLLLLLLHDGSGLRPGSSRHKDVYILQCQSARNSHHFGTLSISPEAQARPFASLALLQILVK